MLHCLELHFNWRQVEGGADFDTHKVGENGVVEIKNITPEAEDFAVAEFYDVKFDDGRVETIYNPNRAFYVKL